VLGSGVPVSAFVRTILGLAAIKVAFGGLVFVAFPPGAAAKPFPDAVFVLLMLVFGGVAAFLVFASQGDDRAVYLGVVFALTAATFADPLAQNVGKLLPLELGPGRALLSSFYPEAFLPYFVWLFYRDFPRGFASPAINRIFRLGIQLSLIVGIALFAANAVLLFMPVADESSGLPAFVRLFDRRAQVSYFFLIVFLLELPTLPLAIWRARKTAVDERRRLNLFLAGLAIGSLPMMLDVILEILFPSLEAWMSVPSTRRVAGLVLFSLVLSVPFTTAYSVLVQRVLDVKLIFRQALRYALARYTVVVVTAVPFVMIIAYIYQHRQQTVSSLFSGSKLLIAFAATAVGLLLFRLRTRITDVIDRKYFRENYDSRIILSSLVERSRFAASVEELATLLQTEIDRALHLESVTILSLESDEGSLRSPKGEIRSLQSSSPLVALAEGSTEPLDIDLEDPQSLLRRLSLEDRQWLADGAFRLLVSLIASDGKLIGLIALGGKRSELRFSREDRMLLKAIAAAVALTLENRLLGGRDKTQRLTSHVVEERRSRVKDELATVCLSCRNLQPPHIGKCSNCGGTTGPADVPYILLGKFRLERVIGSGGMGVVYRGIDLLLRREVAIKTLPKAAPEYAMRLRREARAMATCTHPNLALIFGAETWRGTRMLICEYIAGGTLADKLKTDRSPLSETLHLGITLANVLQIIHDAGILHRDIKPSNIGYTMSGDPKLLDFGLAHMLNDARIEARRLQAMSAEMLDGSTNSLSIGALGSITPSGYVVGTPAYLSPERVLNEASDPSVDLWALALVLYEALSGLNPMARATLSETLGCVRTASVPDIRERVPDCPAVMAAFFNDALAKDRSRRPAMASEMAARLQRVKQEVSSE
jgi:GAF domain-containing protein